MSKSLFESARAIVDRVITRRAFLSRKGAFSSAEVAEQLAGVRADIPALDKLITELEAEYGEAQALGPESRIDEARVTLDEARSRRSGQDAQERYLVELLEKTTAAEKEAALDAKVDKAKEMVAEGLAIYEKARPGMGELAAWCARLKEIDDYRLGVNRALADGGRRGQAIASVNDEAGRRGNTPLEQAIAVPQVGPEDGFWIGSKAGLGSGDFRPYEPLPKGRQPGPVEQPTRPTVMELDERTGKMVPAGAERWDPRWQEGADS